MDKRCFVCKFEGDNSKNTYLSFYYIKTESIPVSFCYGHTLEFFKIGQMKFFLKYQHTFRGYATSAEDEAIIEYVDELQSNRSVITPRNF